MACESYKTSQFQTEQQRKEEIKKALKALEKKLASKKIKIGIDPRTGAIVFKNWSKEERGGISDACAFRKLQSEGSYELRKAIMDEEARVGKKINVNAIESGTHSHDDGDTWHKGH